MATNFRDGDPTTLRMLPIANLLPVCQTVQSIYAQDAKGGHSRAVSTYMGTFANVQLQACRDYTPTWPERWPPDVHVGRIHKIQSTWTASSPLLNAAPQRPRGFEHQQDKWAHVYSQCHHGMACLQLTCLGPHDWTALSFVACLWLVFAPSQGIPRCSLQRCNLIRAKGQNVCSYIQSCTLPLWEYVMEPEA